jgi:hypothetical protein
VRLLAAHDHAHVHAPFVAQLNLRRAIDDAPVGVGLALIEDVGERVMAAGFTGGAHDKIEIAGQFQLGGADEFDRRYHRRQAALLLARTPPPHALPVQFIRRAVDDIAGVGILHRARRRAHGIAYEHQAIAAPASFEVENEIAHLIDEGLEAGFFKLRLDHVADQRQHLRLGFEQFGLRARMLDEFHGEPFDLVVGKVLLDQFLRSSRIHVTLASCLSPQAYQCPSIALPTLPILRAIKIITIQTQLTINASEHIGPRFPST